MKHRQKIAIIVFTMACGMNAHAQTPPDPSWELVPEMSDEFNSATSTTVDTSKWEWEANPGYTSVNEECCVVNDANHMSIQTESGTTFLRLSVTNTSNTCLQSGDTVSRDHSSGYIYGKDSIRYGYFEIQFRIRDGYGIYNSGLSANAWLFRRSTWVNKWSEIDLAEIDARDNRHTCNVIWDPHESPPWTAYSDDEDWSWTFPDTECGDADCDSCYVNDDGIACDDTTWYSNSKDNMRCGSGSYIPCGYADFNLGSGWHKYVCVWRPDKISIYVDGSMVNTTTLGCPGMEKMNWMVGPASAVAQFNSHFNSFTLFPYHMDVNYIRTYRLKKDCSTIFNNCVFWFGGWDNELKKSITVSSGCSNIQPTSGAGSDIALKATDYVLLEGAFTVPVGATFTADVVDCY